MTNHKYNASWIFRWPLALLLALGVWLCVQPLTAWACGGGIICVDADAPGAATGLSWTDAYTNVQDALAVAIPGNEIWVAEGVYYPDEGSGQTSHARTSTFTLTNGVALYGGFAATETLLTQRDWTAHVTVLSGDIDKNDVNGDGNHIAETWSDLVGANAYHVVSLRSVTETAQLDGFTVTAGVANGVYPNNCGSGMVNNWYSSPTLANVTFSGNWANLGGGGMFNDRSSNPTLTNVIFSGNQADSYGGGMYNNWDSNPTLTNVTFSGNQAGGGGGMYNDASSPTLTNGIFSGNRATDVGGGMRNNNSSSPTLTNVTFSGNQADYGGGMSNDNSNPTLVNCILWGDSEPEINNYDSTPNITFSDIQGWSGGGMGNLNVDPQFAAPVAASSAPTTIGNYRLRSVSPAIDAGNNAAVPGGVVTDRDGHSRFVDLPTPDTGSGVAPLVDMGAYEAYPHPLYVDVDATGAATGLSWANAYTKLQDALAVAGAGDEIWVAEGVYYPDEGRGQMNGALTSTFTLRPGAALYGGFAATETLLTQRDWSAHVTVLSGDIDKNDVNGDGNRIAETWNDLQGYNAYHVVTGSGVTETARLDGFTVTAGYANGSAPDNSGGGMTNANSSPTLTHVTFSGNRAANYGGGMVNDAGSRPTLMHVTLSGNQAFFGGGMGNDYSSRPTLTNVTFSGNQATSAGGGMGNVNSNSTLTNVTFSGNQAAVAGGGMYNESSSPTLMNVTFSGNQANSYGGGMYNQQYSRPTLVNCILWGDSAANGPEIYNANNSSPTITYSDIQGGHGGTGNLNAGPQFVAPVAAGSAPTAAGDYRLQLNSPAVDAGNSLSVIVATDLAGNPRIMNGAVDMGAYEAHPNPIYVNADATGAATGLSWTDAYANVQDALAAAVAGNEIWVAAGVYYPDEGRGQTSHARTSTFTLRPGVALYGGFAATETLLTQRDWTAHVTVLSGDIDGNDVNADGNRIAETWNDLQGYNAYHVVTSGGVTETARLDGFTVTAGYANGSASPNRYGGGMTNKNSSPTLTHVTFSGNRAASVGGGMTNDNSSPTLTHVTFSGNAAGGDGGGMDNYNNSSSTLTHVTFSGNQAGGHGGGMDNYNSNPTLTHVAFSGNQAGGDGGGMENGNSSPTLTHVTFSGNQADGYGGGMDNYYRSNPTLTHVIFSGNQAGDVGGGMANYNSSNPTLTNVTFNGNQAGGIGGGMYNGSNPTLTNVTFSGNRATNDGGGMYNDSSSPTLVNCILWGDSATNGPEIYNDSSSPIITYSDIEWESGVYTGTGNLARAPQFVAPIAASSAPTTTGDYRLREDSPAIDAGDPATCPPDDLDGQPRADLRCDMGAYERQYRDGDTVIKRDFTGGTPYSFGPTWVSMTLAAADTGSVTVTKHRTPPGGVWDAGEISVTWWISSSLSAGFPATLSLCYTDAEVADLDESRLAMFRWNGSAWVDQNATPDPAHNCVTLGGVTGFSAWTLKDVSVGAATPTAARGVGLAAWGFAPVAALPLAGLLVLGGALALRYRRRP